MTESPDHITHYITNRAFYAFGPSSTEAIKWPSPKPEIVVDDRLRARFYGKLDKQENGCWHWTGRLKEDGYPNSLIVAGTYYRVSHIALAIDGRPRPDSTKIALHSCDNPPCVNPAHLRWGTELENLEDLISRFKRRGARSFSPDEVRYIRASPARHVDLAKEFGVTSSCILSIRKKVTHKHVI